MNWNETGIHAMHTGDYEEAAKAFTQAIEQEPENEVGYINFGNLLAIMNDAERAERFFQKALTLNEQAATAYYGLANLYYNQERFEEAAKLYERAIRANLEGADGHYMLSKSLQMTDERKLALPYAQRAHEIAPEDAEITLHYAILLASNELFAEAKPLLEQLLEENPEHADAHFNLGVLFALTQEDPEPALHHLDKALEIEPNYDQARYMADMIRLRN